MNRQSIDFLRSPGPPALGIVLLALGMLAMAAALWQVQRWNAEQMRRQADSALRESMVRQRQEASRALPPSPAELRNLQVQQDVRLPWLATLSGIERAAAPPIYLLSMVIEPGTGTVRLEGEAPSFDQAVAFSQRLGATGTLEPATPSMHLAKSDPTSGRSSVQFAVATRWKR